MFDYLFTIIFHVNFVWSSCEIIFCTNTMTVTHFIVTAQLMNNATWSVDVQPTYHDKAELQRTITATSPMFPISAETFRILHLVPLPLCFIPLSKIFDL